MSKIPFVPKYKEIASVIRNRILQGDYSLRDLPSERRLAEEMGVNYMTIRRGLHLLENDRLLVRQNNGRLRVRRSQEDKKHFNLAFVSPTLNMFANVEKWRLAIEKAAEGQPCSVRPLLYMRWDDPTLHDALAGFDGIFLQPIPDPLPPAVAAELRKPQHPAVVLDYDFSRYGVPSIQIFAPSSVQILLDHLASLGHVRIGCINTQPDLWEIHERVNQWRYWMAARGFSGRLIDAPVATHADPAVHAYELMNETLFKDKGPETAWLCITSPCAMGVMRALLDHGLMPGRDVAVCAVDGENVASLLNPRLTAVEAPDYTPYVSYCLRWLLTGQPWQGPLLMHPPHVSLVVRESTQPSGHGSTAAPAAQSLNGHGPILPAA